LGKAPERKKGRIIFPSNKFKEIVEQRFINE